MTLEVLTSELLAGTRHGFFTRRGGASSGVYAGLNCGPGSSDQREAVTLNRARVAAALGVAPERLLSLHQTHSTDVVFAGPEGWTERPRADAAVTATPGIALGILTADCAPVLLHDPEAEVVGAAHAGWRGALEGVLDQPARLRGRPGIPRPLPRRGGGLRPLLRPRPRRPAALRPAGLRARAAARVGSGAGCLDRRLHPLRPGALLLLPPVDPGRRARLRPADLGDQALITPPSARAAPPRPPRRSYRRRPGCRPGFARSRCPGRPPPPGPATSRRH
jgi:hypothetical protein